MEEWTKEPVYDEQISPLMAQIIAICKEHKIPLVAQFQYEDSEEHGPGFVTTMLVSNCPLAHQKMRDMANVARPQRPVALAETRVTDASGKTTITIHRVS